VRNIANAGSILRLTLAIVCPCRFSPQMCYISTGTQSSVRGTQSSVRGTQSSVRGTQSSVRGTQSSVSGTQSSVRGTQSSVREGSYLHSPSAKLFPQAIILCWASLCVIVPARTPLMDMIWSPGITPQLADIVPGVTCSCYTYTQHTV